MSKTVKIERDHWDQRDRVEIAGLFRSHPLAPDRGQRDRDADAGPTGPTDPERSGTTETQSFQAGPTGPAGPTPKSEEMCDTTAPDADGVARTPEAIEAMWSDAVRRAVEVRKTQTAPTCSHCGVSDWLVAITEPDGRRLHVECWKARESR